MSAPWGSSLRLAHGLHRRLPAEWQRTCEHEGCGAVPAGRREKATHCLRHLPNTQARKDAIEAMLRVVTVTQTGAHTVIDLRGTTFDELLLNETLATVEGTTPPGEDAPAWSWSFRKCVFIGRADFTARVFGSATDPQDDYIDFTDAHFDAEATFTGTRFHGRAFFEGTKFTNAVFDQAEFGLDVWFLRTRFDTASLSDATFGGRAYFHQVSADTALAFTGTTFAGPAHLEPLTTRALDLAQAVFEQRATLDLTGSLTADYARFDGGVDVRLRNDLRHAATASLTGVRLGSPSTLTGQLPVPIRPTGYRPELFGALPLLLSLADADVAELTVTDVNLSNCLFAGAINLDKLRMGGTAPFARPPRNRVALRPRRGPRWWRAFWWWSSGGDRPVGGRELLWEEVVARFPEVDALNWDRDWRGPASRHVTDDQLAALYRALRKAREDAKDEPGAGDFYVGEMEARRRGSTRTAERFILTAYKILSGYGQRAARALAWLLLLVLVLTGLLLFTGLPATGPVQRITGTVTPATSRPQQQVTLEVAGPLTALPADRVTLTRVERAARIAVGSVLFRDTDQQLTTAGRWTVNTGRLLGPLLIALAALAIRAQVKR